MRTRAVAAVVTLAAALAGTAAPVAAQPDGFVVLVTEDAVVVARADGSDRHELPGVPPLADCEELVCRSPRPVVPWADVSPDGRRVVYVSDPAAGGGVFVQDLDGGPRAELDDRSGVFTWPMWSYDGTRVAYEGVDGIGTVAADGSDRTLRSRATIQDVLWDWLPDGDLVYRRSTGCHDELWRTSPDGSDDRRLTGGAVDELARSLADGRVAFTRTVPGPDECRGMPDAAQIAVVEADGDGDGVVGVRSVHGGAGGRVTVSADGRDLYRRAFDPRRPGYHRWLRSSLDGSGEEEPVAWLRGAFHVSFGKAPPPEDDVEPTEAEPTEEVATAFVDVSGSAHEEAIADIVRRGITVGCDPAGERFCPADTVTRAQVATFLVRALGLPPASAAHFDDTAGNVHEDDIDRLAGAGITTGVGPRRFSPESVVTREQMATMLRRAWEVPDAVERRFGDVTGTHAGAVEALAAAGLVRGCDEAGTRYCPTEPVRRDHMAVMLSRALAEDAGDPS